MAGSTRRLTFAAITLPFLFLVMGGMARATAFIVNTTDGDSPAAPLCSLTDAITAHDLEAGVNGCPAGSADDTISFAVTGTIFIDATLEITQGSVTINGQPLGCSGAGPCGVTIDGGGAVQLFILDSGTSAALSDLTLADGLGTNGGAIYDLGDNLTIEDCLLRNNTGSAGSGGAIFGYSSGAITIVNSTITRNTATFGAGMWAFPNIVRITNSTISGNNGTGYFNTPSPLLKGVILSNNSLGNCVSTAPTDLNYNISDDGTCNFTGASSINNSTTAALNLDPLGLQNNGGPTETIALISPSNAIDRIPVANCTDQSGNPLGTDQRLYPRPDPGNPNTCDSGAYEVGALVPIVINSERVQIARSSTANSDQVNIGLTFTENGDPTCELGAGGDEDALNDGIKVALFQGTCASIPANGLTTNLDTFNVHTVNHQQYGTLFQVNGLETISARMVALPAPANACSAYTLNLEVAGLNTNSATVNLAGGNPFALVITDELGDGAGCFDITNAIVGNQIPTPGHGVRRGVRRQARR